MSIGDNENDEFIISFSQNGPDFDEKGELMGDKSEDIISLVMSKKSAKKLAEVINGQFDKTDDRLAEEQASPKKPTSKQRKK